MTPAPLARRASAVCFALAATLVLSADSCDREDNGGIVTPGQSSVVGRYGLTAVVRPGTDSLIVPFTYTSGASNYALNAATINVIAGTTTTNNTFTITVSATQNGLATALGVPAGGTWTQLGSTVTFNAIDGSTFTGTLIGNVLRVSSVTIEGRGSSVLRFTRL